MTYRPTYHVERIAAPVLGRHGSVAGVPTVEVRLGPAGKPMGLDAVVSEVRALFSRPEHGEMPRWVWIAGTPSPEAHDLVVGCQVLLKRSVYTEADGTLPMGNIGKLPLYDHVAAFVHRLPVKALKVELFHSVLASMPRQAADLDTLNRFLESREYNGHRFLVPKGPVTAHDMAVLMPHARLWRISPGPVAHPGTRLSPAFAAKPHALQSVPANFRRKSPAPS